MDTEPRPGPTPATGPRRRMLLNVLWWATVAAVVGLFLWLGTPQPLVEVQTPSMVPVLGIGDVAVVRNLRGHVPEVGDIVSAPVPAKVQKENSYPPEVLHRVVSVKDGRLVTKGDNLGQDDPFDVAVTDVNMGYVTMIPGAGKLLSFLRSPFGMIWIG